MVTVPMERTGHTYSDTPSYDSTKSGSRYPPDTCQRSAETYERGKLKTVPRNTYGMYCLGKAADASKEAVTNSPERRKSIRP